MTFFYIYLDIAIGAPFGGSDGNGAVFIYNVRNKTIQSEPSQVRLST